MNDLWNERFGNEEYAYGVRPNQFVKQELIKLTPGKILLPAEGEGRNAVFAAKLGWQVNAFDPSIEGKRKAKLLAQNNQVRIDYKIDNYENVDFEQGAFDCIVLIFAHMHPQKRNEYHQKLMTFLKPGGVLILEGFSKKQMNNTTGGPQNIEMLFSKEEMKSDFASLSKFEISESEVVLNEGLFHQGMASVIRISGIK